MTFRKDQIETLHTTLAWLLDYHEARLADGSQSRVAHKVDRLALMVSRDRLTEIHSIIKAALQ